MVFTKPPSITFHFHQKSPEKGGEIRDSNGQVIYRLHTEADDHSFSSLWKDYPIDIYRASDNFKIATFKTDKPDKIKVQWADGRTQRILGDLLQPDSMMFTLPNGAKCEWDGILERGSLVLYNHNLHSPDSLLPPVSAIYTSARISGNQLKFTMLEVESGAISGGGAGWMLLDHLIVTVLWFEYRLLIGKVEGNLNSLASAVGG